MKRKPKRKPKISTSEAELIRSIFRESFFESVKECWPLISEEEPIWNWHIEYLCNEVQYVVERILAKKPKEYDLVINIPPGTTKSTIISIVLPAWVWSKMPSFRTIVATHTYNPLGLDLSRKARLIVRSDLYQAAFPDIELSEDQDTKGYFANTRGGFRLVATVGGVSPIGLHGHLLIADDPIDPMEARKLSQTQVEEANRWIAEDLQGRKVDKRIVPMILVMQRLKQNDPTGYWLERGGEVKHICLPADADEGYQVMPANLVDNYVDGLLDPIRLPRSVLEEYKLNGEYSYAAQYGQHPIPITGGFFKPDMIEIAQPPMDRIKKIVRYWDKAGTAKKYSDRTAGVKMGFDPLDEIIWVLNVKKGQWDIERRNRIIKQTSKADGQSVRVGVEREFGAAGKESAGFTVKELMGFSVQPDLPTGDKVTRAEPFATWVNNGRVKLAPGEWNNGYLDELQYFPHGKFKDQVDASSAAFSMLSSMKHRLEEWLEAM